MRDGRFQEGPGGDKGIRVILRSEANRFTLSFHMDGTIPIRRGHGRESGMSIKGSCQHDSAAFRACVNTAEMWKKKPLWRAILRQATLGDAVIKKRKAQLEVYCK